MPRFTRNEAQEILNAVMKAGSENLDNIGLTLDSVDALGEQMHVMSEQTDLPANLADIYEAILDGALDYKKQHGSLPDASHVAAALEHAAVILDDAVNGADGQKHSTTAFVPMKPLIAIRAMIATAIPFASSISVDRQSGEGSISDSPA